MAKGQNVIHLACPHAPHTTQVQIKCRPPEVVFSSCKECTKEFLKACANLGGELVKPKIVI